MIEGGWKAASLDGLPKTPVPREHRIPKKETMTRVYTGHHQVQGNRDPSTVFTFPYLTASRVAE